MVPFTILTGALTSDEHGNGSFTITGELQMKTRSYVITTVAMAFATTASIAGANEAGHWYVAPAVNYVIADDDRRADDDFGGQIGFGRDFGNSWNVELNLEANNLDFKDDDGTWKQRGASLNGLYLFNRDSTFSPYGLIGVGALQNRLPGDKVTNVMGNAGLGFLYGVSDTMVVRGEARYRWDDDDESVADESGFGDVVVSLGVQIPLGGHAEKSQQ